VTSVVNDPIDLDASYTSIGQDLGISDRDRHLVAIVALTQKRSERLLRVFLRSALRSGLFTAEEYQEIGLGAAVYLGFPSVGTVLRPALFECAREVSFELGGPLLLNDPSGRHENGVKSWESVHGVVLRPTDDLLMSAAVDFVCGEVYSRPGLSMRDRRLLTAVILTGQGLAHALTVHVRTALADGDWDAESLSRIAVYLASFIGLDQADALGRTLRELGHARGHD
jgi:4-carboxymuconolactone decarboxylase